jgi:lia operon protein LiaF
MIGKVTILVPYEIDVSVHHSAFIGTATVFHRQETKVFNQTLHFHTPEYDKAEQKVKIVTSIISGDIEVKRV